jgi:hypothetical protein
VELAEMLGTAPGLLRLRVTDEGAADWRALISAIECRDHAQDESADTTAALSYAAKDLTVKGGASVTGGVVEHTALTAGWVSILNSKVAGVGHMTHRGVRRLWVRAEDLGVNPGDVELRVRWRPLGALSWTVEDAVPSPLVDAYQLLDLGECRPQVALLGNQQWEFEVQARAPSGSGKVRLKRVYPLSVEQLAVLRAIEGAASPNAQSTKTSAGTAADLSSIGSVSWTNPGNAKASDNSYATVELSTSQESHYLAVSNFSFALPEGATVTGVIATPERQATKAVPGGRVIRDNAIRLLKAGAAVGNNQAAGTIWPEADESLAYGASDDDWGVAWAASDINATGFGVAISVKHDSTGAKATAKVDAVTVTVYYTEARRRESHLFRRTVCRAPL